MPTIPAFKINGVIDTSKTVISNIDAMCKASGCWITYDSTTAHWNVVINKAGYSSFSFNDSNILGSINITGTGLDQLYNSVEVTFPSQDLLNSQDSVNLSLDPTLRYPNESGKQLTMSLDLVNNPVQAAYIAAIELKQNRCDKIIQFKTDYTALTVRAGDLIDVTSSMYGFNSKVFRVTKITEEDNDDGTIQLGITALEYDDSVYDASGLIYTARTTSTGVVPKNLNSALTGLEKASNTNLVYSFQTNFFAISGVDYTTPWTTFIASSTPYNLGQSMRAPYTGKYRVEYYLNFGTYYVTDGSGNPQLPSTIRKLSGIGVKVNGSFYESDPLLGGTTAIKGDDPNTDVSTFTDITVNKGDQLDFYSSVLTDLTSASPGTNGNTAYSRVAISASVFFLGT